MKDDKARDLAFDDLIAFCEKHIGFAGMDRLSVAQIFAAGWSAHEQYMERWLGLTPADRSVPYGTPYAWVKAAQRRADALDSGEPDAAGEE